MSEIDWKSKMANSGSTPDLEERRKLLLVDEAVKLAEVFGIKEILLGIKGQVLREGEVVGDFKRITPRSVVLSLHGRTPIGSWVEVSLRSPIEIHIPPSSTWIRGGLADGDTAHSIDLPEINCKGHLSLDVRVYAGFEDINDLSFGGKDAYLRNNQLKKEGAIQVEYQIGPDKKPEHALKHKSDQLFSASFDRDNFPMEEIKEELINTLARFLSSHDLKHAELHYFS